MKQNKKNKRFYHIITYGCQMNERDSEKLAGMLEEIDYQKTDEPGQADIIFFNTCTIREKAELKVFGKLGSFKELKEKNPDLIIGIGGCMMQIDETVDKIYQKFPYVDLIIGTHNIHHLPDLIKKIKAEKKRVIEVWDKEEGLIPDVPSSREGDFKAWVSIIQGCNNFCSYCIVPYVRGRERSRNPEDIIQEVKKLTASGVKEITLLGQNVNSYGKDLEHNIDFSDLLKQIDEIDGLYRLRYMTSHPRDFSQKLIKTIKNTDKVCEHFHLPLQAGSTDILKKMNRGYTASQYLELVEAIKEEIPGSSITTDIIVGFPGETEKDFQKTLEMIKKIKFDMAFTFAYSPRKGTPASDIKSQVPEEIKQQRLQRLMKIQNKISRQKNKQLKDQVVEVLVEGESKNNPETYSGRTRTYKLIIIPRREGLKGELVNVKINNVQSWTLYGEILTECEVKNG